MVLTFRAQVPRARSTYAARWLILASGALWGFGCQGASGDSPMINAAAGSGSTNPGAGAGGTSNSFAGASGAATATAGGTVGPTALDCSKPQAGPTRLALLTSTQFNNTVIDLLGASGAPGSSLSDAVFGSLDDTAVEQRANVVASVASSAVANLSKWAPCTPPATGSSAACEDQIINSVGPRLYRRPLAASEQAELKTLFDAGVKEKDFSTGVEWFLTGVLQSPDFTYQIVRPDPTEQAGEVRPLAPYEYASRLSYFVWDSPPDDQLMTAASANDFADASKRQAQLTRMIRDARFARGVERFYRRWLNIQAFGELARNSTGFDQKVVTALGTSLLMTATELYSSGSPNISSLFSGESYYMNDVLRGFYGVTGNGTTFSTVPMPNQSRRGILTHPALMALLARPAEDNPISRGLFVLRNVLCFQVPPPPTNLVIPPLAPIQAGLSTRQRLDAHAKDPVCASCHAAIDPAGFAFENFDEVGRYRTSDQGVNVDTSGTLALNIADIDGAFTSGDALLDKIANSKTVKTCFAEKYLDFALAREVTDKVDACSIESIGQSFSASGDLKQLVATVASSDSFRLRLAEGLQP